KYTVPDYGQAYFNDDGAWVKTGWLKMDGATYYVENNTLASGWYKIGNYWYYFATNNNKMATGSWIIGSDVYEFDTDGHWIVNTWYNKNGKWYYYDQNGARIVDGWVYTGSKWYYIKNGNLVCNDCIVYKGFYYGFDASGAMVTNKWMHHGDEIESAWRYYNADGNSAKGWLQLNGSIYYFDADNDDYALQNESMYIKDNYYFFDDNCAMVTNKWIQEDDYWYYYESDGKRCFGWKLINGSWYYFIPNEDGKMAYNGIIRVENGYRYVFDDAGHYTTTKI
ncbi:MAG: hypothetical protein HUJ53_05280, partial [Holdemanella sp.]|nr:hypothetical protein [Holdemanella sp.]